MLCIQKVLRSVPSLVQGQQASGSFLSSWDLLPITADNPKWGALIIWLDNASACIADYSEALISPFPNFLSREKPLDPYTAAYSKIDSSRLMMFSWHYPHPAEQTQNYQLYQNARSFTTYLAAISFLGSLKWFHYWDTLRNKVSVTLQTHLEIKCQR